MKHISILVLEGATMASLDGTHQFFPQLAQVFRRVTCFL
jgi:hypothetical protein